MGLDPNAKCAQCEKSLAVGWTSAGWLCPSRSMCMFCDECARSYRKVCPYHDRPLRSV